MFRLLFAAALGCCLMLQQYGCSTVIDCNFEANRCAWVDDLVMGDEQILFALTPTASILASDAKSANAILVPVNHNTPSSSLSFLKNTAGNVAKGQLYCLSFDFAVTNPGIGWLSIWHYWLNEAGAFYNKQIWSSVDVPFEAGRWLSAQVLVDGEGDWTLVAEVIVDPTENGIPVGPVSGRGVALDNIKATPIARADQCAKLPAAATAPPATVPAPTAAPTEPATPTPTAAQTEAPTALPTMIDATDYVANVSIQLGEFHIEEYWNFCDTFSDCDLIFRLEYLHTTDTGEHTVVQNFAHLPDANHLTFENVAPLVFNRVRKGSVMTVKVDVKDHDDGIFSGDHDDIAFFTFQYTVPSTTPDAPTKITLRNAEWYRVSDMDMTFTTVI